MAVVVKVTFRRLGLTVTRPVTAWFRTTEATREIQILLTLSGNHSARLVRTMTGLKDAASRLYVLTTVASLIRLSTESAHREKVVWPLEAS